MFKTCEELRAKIAEYTAELDSKFNGADGKTATSNFISGLMKSVPPLEDLFKLAGMELPSYLKGKSQNAEVVETSAEEA